MEKEKLFVFRALYNPMFEESAYHTLSLHKTKKGAEMAISFHKEQCREDWMKLYGSEEDREDFPFALFERWLIDEMEVED